MSDRRLLPPWLGGRLIFGVTVLVLGVLFTLDRLGLADAGAYVRYWPLALVAVGLIKLIEPDGGPRRVFGAALALFGGGLLLDNLHLFHFDWGVVFPLFLLFIGAALVWQALGGRAPAPGGQSAGTVSGFAVLGGVKRRSTSTAFRGGDASAVLGACELDLRQAALAPEGAVIDTFALWGGVEIKVPGDWEVEVRGTPILGGFEDLTKSGPSAAAGRLVIKGLAIMGGVEVKN
jgi:LiaF transmembrane domain